MPSRNLSEAALHKPWSWMILLMLLTLFAVACSTDGSQVTAEVSNDSEATQTLASTDVEPEPTEQISITQTNTSEALEPIDFDPDAEVPDNLFFELSFGTGGGGGGDPCKYYSDVYFPEEPYSPDVLRLMFPEGGGEENNFEINSYHGFFGEGRFYFGALINADTTLTIVYPDNTEVMIEGSRVRLSPPM
jgi:hypothetical protein